MKLLSQARHFLRNLLRKQEVEADLDQETRSLLELLIEEKTATGLNPKEARRRALIELGGSEQIKGRVREVRMGKWLEDLWQDIRYGLRTLRKNPGFTTIAVLTLALGIGANTAIFSFVKGTFLQQPNVPGPDRLVRLYGTDGDRRFGIHSYPNYADVRDRNQVFENLAAHRAVTVAVGGDGDEAESVRVELVAGNYFSVFGVGTALGRVLQPDDDVVPGAHPVVVIGDSFWRRKFGSDPEAVGSTIRINSTPFTVVGVMPAHFRGSYQLISTEVWAPIMMHNQVRPIGLSHERRGWGWLGATGRLKPGVTIEQAQAEMNRVAQLLEKDFPRFNKGVGYRIVPVSVLPDQMRNALAGALSFLVLFVSLVLLVACANIAGVLLARVVARRREIAVRRALGAGRARLVRQWVTETMLLAFAGGLAGLLVAAWCQRALLVLASADKNFANFSPNLQFDGKILGFTFVLTILTGLLCSVFPAARASGADVVTALKEETASASGGRRRSRLQNTFVVAQVTVSLLLLVVAGLLVRTLQKADAFDPGFNTKNVLLASVNLRSHGYDAARGRDFYSRLSERLQALPGVERVTFTNLVPLSGDRERQGYRIEGHEPSAEKPLIFIDTAVVGPGYFATMGIPIQRGRDFAARDAQPGAQPIAIINETMARKYWPGGNALGERFQFGRTGPFAEIVGVARDSKYYALAEEPLPYVYGSAGQVYFSSANILIRTSGDPSPLVGAVRREVAALDSAIVVRGLGTFAQLRQSLFLPQRILAIVSIVFSLLALLLTGLGLYGVVSYSVTQRTHEIGIRMALGAQRGDILKLVVGQGMMLILIGVAVGLVGAFALTRFLQSLLFGVAPTDPVTFVGVSLLLAAVALLACYIPARRATKVDPMVALRYE